MAMHVWGSGLSQNELMLKDECIVVDENDRVIGNCSKKEAHTFSKENPRGILHRAFSVFLFNEKGQLLLQQRAADKITFPNVWTNTCCSHPLYGFTPTELDETRAVERGEVKGVKNAAIRKLEHELGIKPSSLKVNDFKFLTRLHYWAADVVTHGKKSPWGEHEIDYILFIQKSNVQLNTNKEEVSAVKWVTLPELQEMMKPSSGLLWSPWFRIIAEQFLPHWWADLGKTLNTDTFVDVKTIHRFDPTPEHMGGAGQAGAYLGPGTPYRPSTGTTAAGDASKKQGAYGKIITHEHSKLEQFLRVDEVFAALWYKTVGEMEDRIDERHANADVVFCNKILGSVSRSFAAVIRQLPKGLCLDIVIFYLALRALDTIEDDMDAFKGREHVKIDHLKTFYKTALVTDGWHMTGVGQGDERALLEGYYKCVTVFKSLPESSQEVIADITRRMGEGMASYVQKDLGQGTVTVADYDLYCHYVAGLVGEGLTRLFASTGYESDSVRTVAKTLANTMGLFLQKTNIIRDYLEDYVDGRAFWPQEIWKKYAPSGDLGELAKPEAIDRAVHCLNELVTNALTCVPDCMTYMSMLRTEEVFRFCAIPQVMAIATLAEVYNNPKVFTGVVKIRKGLAVKLILDTKTVGGLHKWFYLMALDILKKVPANDPNAAKTREICGTIINLTQKIGRKAVMVSYAQAIAGIATIMIFLNTAILSRYVGKIVEGRPQWHLDALSLANSSTSMFEWVNLLSLYLAITAVFIAGVMIGGANIPRQLGN